MSKHTQRTDLDMLHFYADRLEFSSLQAADEAAKAIRQAIQEIKQLRLAAGILWWASYQSHNGHWDKTGGSGSGCPECQQAMKLRDRARKILGDSPDYPEEGLEDV